MALFDFFKPRWKSGNPEVRLAAVPSLDLSALEELVRGDEDERVRLAAAERIDARAALEGLSRLTLPPSVSRVVQGRLEALLFRDALGGSEAALERIEDPSLLERLATEAPAPALRVAAVGRTADPEALCRILERNCGKEAARAALSRIGDEALLVRLSKTGASKVTRRLAEERLAARAEEREAPLRRARRERELEGLVGAAEALAEAPEAVDVGRLAALRRDWDRADPERSHPRWPAFRAAAGRVEERRAEELRRQAEARRQQEEDRQRAEEERRRHEAESRRARAVASAEPPAAAEPAVKPTQGGERAGPVPAEEATPPEGSALARREALCSELEALVEAEDRAAAGRRARALRRAWGELPPLAAAAERDLGERFEEARRRFAASQEGFDRQQEWLRWNNKTLKEGLCAEAEALEAEEDPEVLAGKVRDLQRRWKQAGPVPAADARPLWERFKGACDRGFERARPHLEELDRLRAETAARREALCLEAEGWVDSTDWKAAAEALKQLQARWKEGGPLPRRRDEELYSRFRRACDGFFERRKAHFAALDEERGRRLEEKERLCARAEALADAPERSHAGELRQLQAEWKRVGPAPREAEPALWARFRGACDRYFDWLGGERGENLRRKEALCAELDALRAGGPAASGGAGEAVAELRRRWAEIGPVPADRAEALWDRFQELCEAVAAEVRRPAP